MPALQQQQPLERPYSQLMQVAQDPEPSPESKYGEGHTSQSVDHTSPKTDSLVLMAMNLEGVSSNV